MARQRPCSICKKWFRVHARAGARQRVCSAAACQRERHRQSCRRWHGNNPDYDREDRLRRRLLRDPPEQAIPELLNRPPMAGLDREAARDAVGLEVIVLLEVAAQLLWDGVRDAVRPQVAVGQSVGTKVLPGRVSRFARKVASVSGERVPAVFADR
jgi:hypothetical protein